MKKRIIGWMALCLLLCCIATQGLGETAEETAVPEETEQAELPEVDEFFRSMVGQLSFTLPGVPNILIEADLTEADAQALDIGYAGWLNKLQLAGQTDSGAEYQIHIGDVTPMMNWMRADHPDEEEEQYQINAMVNMAKFYLSLFKGEITKEVEPAVLCVGNRDFPAISFAFQYPDAEGVKYSAKAIMDGSWVVLMMCQLDDMNEAVLYDFRPVTAEEAEAFHSRQPETVTLGRMQAAFPVPPVKHESAGHILYHVFSPDYAYLTAEYMAIPMGWMMEDEDEDSFLDEMTRGVAEQYREAGYFDTYTVRKAAEGAYMFEAEYTGNPGMALGEGLGQVKEIMRAYLTLDGVYIVDTTDTPMGRAFFDSIVFADAAQEE